MATEFNLPGSSLEELKKIILAYSHLSDKATGEEVGKLVGVHRTTISKNSKFMIDCGLITSGAQKAATELGRKLGRAIEHGVSEDISRYWRESISQSEKFSNLVTTLRIKGGMTEKAFTDHILYVSGEKSTSGNKTGARTVVDVLIAAGLIMDNDGNLTVVRRPLQDPSTSSSLSDSVGDGAIEAVVAQFKPKEADDGLPPPAPVVSISPTPQITINIQLQIPEVSDSDIYEKLFKALADNLFPPKNA